MKTLTVTLILLAATAQAHECGHHLKANEAMFPEDCPEYRNFGVVITEKPNGDKLIQQEVFPGSGMPNAFKRGYVIQERGNTTTIRPELIPGSGLPNHFDR